MRRLLLVITTLSALLTAGCFIQEHQYPTISSIKPSSENKTNSTKQPVPQSVGSQQLEPELANELNKTNDKPITSTANSVQYKAYSTIKRSVGQQLNIAQLWRKYPDIFKFHAADRTKRKVALTFDDVPDHRLTPIILDILKKHHIQATFFIEGYRAKANPDVVKRMVAEGHVIGNHSYDHPLLTRSTIPAFVKQLQSTESIVNELIGYKPRFFRPPYGEITEEQLQWAGDHGYIVVNWDVDSNDWRGISADKVERNIMSGVQAGSIVLQHAGGGSKRSYLQNTVQALPKVIQQLRNQDYEFVTLPQLFEDQKEKREY